MKPKSIELISFGQNHEIQYQGKCKLRIDRLSKMLLVVPVNEGSKIISALFEWDFVSDKNILFIFGEHELSDFALIFDKEKRCKKVFNFVCNGKAQNDNRKEMLHQHFLLPISNRIIQKDDGAVKLKKLIVQWIDNHEEKTKEEYLKLLHENCLLDGASLSITKNEPNETVENKNVNAEKDCNIRKRRSPENGNLAESKGGKEVQPISKKTEISPKLISKINSIDQALVKIVNVKSESKLRSRLHRRLLIFSNIEKTLCYEFSYNLNGKLYTCIGCKEKGKQTTFVSQKDENGITCVKMDCERHVCTPKPYIPQKYVEMTIIKKPDYELLENCNTFCGKMLIIFDKNDKQECWEFQRDSKYIFKCRQCNAAAKVWNENMKNEYIELKDARHTCKYIPYEPKKYYQFNEFVVSPDFELQLSKAEDGKERKRLIIFDPNDRKQCYIYHFNGTCFQCRACRGHNVTAKLLQNADGEEYVILSKAKHSCQLRSYPTVSTKNEFQTNSDFPKMEENIIRPPAFELMENTANGKSKLFIFDSNDRNLCYTFSQKDENLDKYYCLGCCRTKLEKCSSAKKGVPKIYGELCKDEAGLYFVFSNNQMKHICKPEKYEPERYAKKEEAQKCYEFFFFRLKKFKTAINVAIYHPENKKLCFKMTYSRAHSYFFCNECKKKGESFISRIKKDENGEEFFTHDYKKHVCKPIKTSSLRCPEIVMLKRDKLNLDVKEKMEDRRIIKHPNFELHPNQNGVKDGILFIFDSKDRSLEYKYYRYNGSYHCKKSSCCWASAKLQINENGEKYIILGKIEHKCEPLNLQKKDDFEDEKEIIKASNFFKFCQNDDDKITKIIVFTASDREQCHEYGAPEKNNKFSCLGCQRINKSTPLKLCKDKNGEEYLKMSNQEHACQPRKYLKEKYEPKIIPPELFELRPNTRGEANKRLVVFTSTAKDSVYEFYSTFNNSYVCIACLSKYNKSVGVKVLKDKNDQNYVKCGVQEHLCQPQLYDPKKYDPTANLVPKNLFVFQNGNNGETDKYLIIFTSEKKEFAYKYSMLKSGRYYCLKCSAIKKSVNVKVAENEDGSKSVELGKNEHVCEPQKYNPQKYDPNAKFIARNLFVFYDDKNGKENKYLIIFTSEKKDFAYHFRMQKLGHYYCLECKNKKKSTSAIVIVNEDGSKSVKLGNNEHICEPQCVYYE